MATGDEFCAAEIIRNGAVPAYYQIESCLRSAIEGGRLTPGDELPSEQEMAESFGVNRLTVRRAVQELAAKGLVVRSQGRRSRVAMRKIPLDPFGSFAAQVTAQGLLPGSIVQECAVVTPNTDLRRLLCRSGQSRILHIARTRLLDSTPVAVEDNFLRADFAAPFTDDAVRAEHLYDSLREHCQLTVWDVDADAEMRAADAHEAARLDVREGHPLFSLRITLLNQGKAFGCTFVRFLADRFHFRLGLQRYPVNV